MFEEEYDETVYDELLVGRRRPGQIYPLTDVRWLFFKMKGTVEPVYVVKGNSEKGTQVISLIDGKAFEEAGKMLDNKESETETLMLMDSYDAIEKYAARRLNKYWVMDKLMYSLDPITPIEMHVAITTLTLGEVKKLAQIITKVYKRDNNEIELSNVNWLVNSEELTVEPFIVLPDSGLPYSLKTGDVVKSIVQGKNADNKSIEILSSYDAIMKYAMHKLNRYSFEAKFLEDGLDIEDSIITQKRLKKLEEILKEGLEKEAQKAQREQ